VLPWGTHYQLVGEHRLGAEASGAVTLVGNTHANLEGFDARGSADEFIITHGLGNVEIDLPTDRKTELNLSSFAGRFEISGDEERVIRGGLFNHRSITVNNDGREPVLTVTVRIFGGNIIINEEN